MKFVLQITLHGISSNYEVLNLKAIGNKYLLFSQNNLKQQRRFCSWKNNGEQFISKYAAGMWIQITGDNILVGMIINFRIP